MTPNSFNKNNKAGSGESTFTPPIHYAYRKKEKKDSLTYMLSSEDNVGDALGMPQIEKSHDVCSFSLKYIHSEKAIQRRSKTVPAKIQFTKWEKGWGYGEKIFILRAEWKETRMKKFEELEEYGSI